MRLVLLLCFVAVVVARNSAIIQGGSGDRKLCAFTYSTGSYKSLCNKSWSYCTNVDQPTFVMIGRLLSYCLSRPSLSSVSLHMELDWGIFWGREQVLLVAGSNAFSGALTL